MQSGTDKFMCVSCGFVKIEDAFPRAQLRQDDATSKQKCLSCVRSLQQLTCAICKMDKAAHFYSPTMLTHPSDRVVCCACQLAAQDSTNRYSRTGWFTCKHCRELIWAATVPGVNRVQHCLNCSSRTTRVRDQHTCRSCGDRWMESQTDLKNRQRLCLRDIRPQLRIQT
eukprot:1082861-Amphidinium_carterae.1